MSTTSTTRHGHGHSRHDWVTVSLLISLSPLAFTIGLLVAMSDAISRVVGHRGKLLPRLPSRKRGSAYIEEKPIPRRKIVLISGATPVGLALARGFTNAGHRVVIVDQEAAWRLSKARYSRGVSDFVAYDQYVRSRFGKILREAAPYPEQMMRLANLKKADIWVPCEDWSTDEEKMQAAGVIRLHRPDCLVLFPGPESLDLSWDRVTFSKFITSLDSTIKTPASNIVRSRGQIHSLLGAKESKRSLLVTGPLPRDALDENDEFVKGHRWRDSGYSEYSSTTANAFEDYENEDEQTQRSYKLPLETLDKTYDLLTSIPISPVSPWNVSEIVFGKPCIVHALVEETSIRAFTALMQPIGTQFPTPFGDVSPFTEQPTTRKLSPIDPASSLFVAFKSFTQLFVSKLPGHSSSHLTLHFILTSKPTDFGVELRPWVVDCKFNFPTSLQAIPDATATWASSIARLGQKVSSKRSATSPGIASTHVTGVYSFPAAFFQQSFISTWLFLTWRLSFANLLRSWRDFSERVFYWREELWDKKDPVPFIWFWAVERPIIAVIDVLWRILLTLRLVSADS
jgi:hypothetical protein